MRNDMGPHYAVGTRPDDPYRNGDGDGILIATPNLSYAHSVLAGMIAADEDNDATLPTAFTLVDWLADRAAAALSTNITVFGYGIVRHERPVSECEWCEESWHHGIDIG